MIFDHDPGRHGGAKLALTDHPLLFVAIVKSTMADIKPNR